MIEEFQQKPPSFHGVFHGQVGLLGGFCAPWLRAAAQREGARLARGAALRGGSLRNAPEHLQVGTRALIGLREKLQEHPIFHGKIYGFL